MSVESSAVPFSVDELHADAGAESREGAPESRPRIVPPAGSALSVLVWLEDEQEHA